MQELQIKRYTRDCIPDVLAFEKELRRQEDVWGWEIDEQYKQNVADSFEKEGFENAVSFLACQGGKVIGRIDAVLLPSHFDGSVKAYLDWICVLKDHRHQGAAQALLAALKDYLRAQQVKTLIALTAANEEAQRFYQSIPNALMRDTGIWIDV